MPHGPTASLRGNKYHENVHRPYGTNVIGTLDHTGVWTTHPPGGGGPFGGMTLDAALNAAMSPPLNHTPLLWAYVGDAMSWHVKFGFDLFVPVLPAGSGLRCPSTGGRASGHADDQDRSRCLGGPRQYLR